MSNPRKKHPSHARTHELFARTGKVLGDLALVALFSRLGGMKPTADAQTLRSVFALALALADDDLLHRVETPPGLHLEKHKLVPRRRDALARDGLRLQRHNATVAGSSAAAAAIITMALSSANRVELERAAPLLFPRSVGRERHVEDVRDASRADDVVVVEQVAALAVRVDRHVLFHAREWAAARDAAQEIAELDGIERIAELQDVREERQLLFTEVGKGRKIAGLVDLFGKKRKKEKKEISEKKGSEGLFS